MDDIIIWSANINDYVANVSTIMEALRKVCLYCNEKKTVLFAKKIDFLGHTISTDGISADKSKLAKILKWLQPQSASNVCAFLGLIQYLAIFLPNLANYTNILTLLTTKEAKKVFPR